MDDAARAFEFHDDWQFDVTATRYQLEEVKRTCIHPPSFYNTERFSANVTQKKGIHLDKLSSRIDARWTAV